MIRNAVLGALAAVIALGQVAAASANTIGGMESNRTALGLPTNARMGSCVHGAGCTDGSSQLMGGPSILIPLLLAGIVAGGITVGVEKTHPHYTPVSP